MENLRKIREEKGLSQRELGNLVGVAASTIANYENDERKPGIDILCRIADALDVSLDILVRGKEKDRPERRSVDEAVALIKGMTPEEQGIAIAIAAYLKANRASQGHPGQESQEDS